MAKKEKKTNETESLSREEEKDKELIEKKSNENEEKKGDKKSLNDEQAKQQQKIILGLIGVAIIVILGFLVVFSAVKAAKEFEYRNFEWRIIKEKEVTFYYSQIGLYRNGKHISNLNIFLRNDPRKLDKEIPFDGRLEFSDLMVINMSSSLNCEGDGIISIANMDQIIKAFNVTIINDPEASCDELGRYIFAKVKLGEKTQVKQVGNKCYDIEIKDCEVLKGTERFLLEFIDERY